MTTHGKKINNSHQSVAGVGSLTYTSNHAIISLLILLVSPTVQSQSDGSGPRTPYAPEFSSSMAIIIVVLVAALFLMGFFSIYFRHCSTSDGNSVRAVLSIRSRREAASRGLAPAVIETFPTFDYSEVKGRKIGKGALECAVCLNEFEDDETLRLIPKCNHVFHPDCIDAWLANHVTCPVCRANLVPQADESTHHPDPPNLETDIENQGGDDGTTNTIADGNNVHELPVTMDRSSSMNRNRPPRSWSVRPKVFGKFRSHSTGHSLVQPGENMDRFTLRLPDELRKEMMNRALINRAASCRVTLPREGSSRKGEGSSRGGRSFKRLEKLDRSGVSERWVFPFFSRSDSIKSPKLAVDTTEASTSSTTPKGRLIKMASFNCLITKKGDDETGLVSADSARHPV